MYGYDAASNRTSIQRRGGATVTYAYDKLGNVTSETHPATAGDANISNTWSNLHQLLTTQTTQSSAVFHDFGYDALGRLTTQTSVQGKVTIAYDAAGNRTQLTWPDNFYVTYAHDYTGETTAIREPSVGSTPGLLLETFNYDDLGRRTSLVRSNGTSTSYYWDGISRFSSLAHNLSGASQSEGVTYDVASQVLTRQTSNDGWAWTGAYNVNRSYGTNTLNQVTTSGPNTLTWSPAGNLTSDSTRPFGYDSVNRLITTTVGSTNKAIAYDGAGRVFSAGVPGQATRFLYDGQEAIAEYDVNNNLLRRYVHGPGVDEPLVWYEGANTSQRIHLYADRQGSIVATAGDNGALTAINAYDEYGLPNTSMTGRFGYTGQKFLSEVSLYDFKARIYSPTLGRFMSPDPIGYGDGMNFYAYIQNTPVNGKDAAGTDPVIGATVGLTLGIAGGLVAFATTPHANFLTFAVDVGGGALTGAAIGALDPSFGVVTLAAALSSGAIDFSSQFVKNHGLNGYKPLETLGAIIGGGLGGFLGVSVVRLGLPISTVAGKGLQSLGEGALDATGGLVGVAPTLLGGLLGGVPNVPFPNSSPGPNMISPEIIITPYHPGVDVTPDQIYVPDAPPVTVGAGPDGPRGED